jgi:TatD DNase family protein
LPFVDAHVHLVQYEDTREVIAAARAAGVLLCSCSVNAAESSPNLRLKDDNASKVYSFLGVHPSDVDAELPSASIGVLFEKADGIGEIGLDEKYSSTARDGLQMRAFLDQLAVAEKLRKPVEVHSRGSEGLCLDTMSSFRLESVLMHWFENEERLPEVVSRGYFVSVGPAALYSKKIRRLASAVPLDRVLTESDGPVAYKALGGVSGPTLIPSVLFCLAELKGERLSELEDEVMGNFERFLGRRSTSGASEKRQEA